MGLIGRSGIQFFGKMSASISHDLKNVLAVINENAGLLEDLSFMAEKGKPLDPARMKRLAADVKNQVRRGDQIISCMNRFAHTPDLEAATIDLWELLGLLAELSLRYASMRGVRLEIHRPADAVTVTTAPFVLLNLLWYCLDFAMAAAGPGKTVELAAQETGDGARLKFRKLAGMAAAAASFPDEPESALMQALKAQIRLDSVSQEVVVTLPGTVLGT
jgi:C4-dicarboxylate-specific signal transduction histidine kinase